MTESYCHCWFLPNEIILGLGEVPAYAGSDNYRITNRKGEIGRFQPPLESVQVNTNLSNQSTARSCFTRFFQLNYFSRIVAKLLQR